MSKTVDERVVQMQFDNKQFESGVQTSLSTLDKLKKSLDFTGSAESFSEIDSAANKVDLSGLGEAVETVHAKFSAFEVIAVTALANITNSAINTGKQLVSSLSIDQISAGWEKYAEKTTAVQTIMSATANTWEENAEAIGFTGTQMEFVTDQLEKLNWFSDETSYSFTDMTSNIGKFTSNGVALTDAVQAMQGISTWAAKSGQSTNEASRAMYNLAQAMSVGAVTLVDWKSIENANMATQEFKQTAIDTAVELGTLTKVEEGLWETTAGSTVSLTDFNSALTKDKWFTSDVLMATLNEYGAASVRLSEICDEYGTTASQFLSGMNDYEKGTKTINDIASDVGIKASDLIPLFEELSGEEYELGLASFKAAQEAKTFSEAIDATKDAVSTGWMTTFDTIFGNYEEAKVLWTDLANALWDVFAASSEVRNGILAVWKDEGGRDDLIEAFWNLWEAASAVVTPIKEAFNEIFRGTSDTTADEYLEKAGKRLANITKAIKEFTEKLKLNDETSDKLKRTFKGLFAALDIVKQAVSALFGGLKPLLSLLPGIGDGVLGVTSSFSDWIVALDEYLKENDVFKKGVQGVVEFIQAIPAKIDEVVQKLTGVSLDDIFGNIGDIFNSVVDKIKNTIGGLKDIDTSGLTSFVNKIKDKTITAGEIFDWLIEKLGEVIQSFKGKIPDLSSVTSSIANGFTKLVSALASVFSSEGFDKLVSLVQSGILTSIGVGIARFANNAASIPKSIAGVGEELKNVVGNVNEVLEGVQDCLKAYQNNLKSKTLINIAVAIGILAASLVALSLVDSEKLAGAVLAMTVVFGELMAAMAAFTKITDGTKVPAKAIASLVAISVSMGILAISLKSIASLDWNQLAVGLTGLGGIAVILTSCMVALQASSSHWSDGSISGLITFAITIGLLTISFKFIANEDWNGIAKGLTGLAGIAAIMTLCIVALQAASSHWKDGSIKGLISFSIAIGLLTISFKFIANEDWDGIAKGLSGLAGIAATMTICMVALQASSSHWKDGSIKGLISFAIAIGLLTISFKFIANEDWDGIAKGLTGLAGISAIMTICMVALQAASGKWKDGSVSGLITFAVAIGVLTISLKAIADEDWDGIKKGLVGIAGVTAIMGVALTALSVAASKCSSVNMAGVAASVLLMATAILVLTPALKALGSMSIGQVATALIALAGAFAVMGIAATVLTPVIPLMLALAGAMALIGVATLAFGAGLLATSTALAALGGSLSIFTSSLSGIINTILQTIIDSVGQIGEAIKAVVLTAVDVLVECVPVLADGALQLILAVLDSLVTYLPDIVDRIISLVIGILDVVATRLPELIQAAVDVFMAFFSGIVEALNGIDTTVLIEGIAGIGLIAALMVALGAIATLVPEAMIGIAGMGLVIAELGLVLAAIGALAQIPGLEWLINEGGDFLQSIGTALGKFVGGIVGGIASGISSQLPQIGADLSEFMVTLSPFIDGAASINADMLDGVNALAETILILTKAEILNGLSSWLTGGSSLADFGEQLVPFGQAMSEFSDSVSGLDSELVTNAANAGLALAEMATTLPNSGGVVSWFTGNNDMKDFADQLVPFGEAMMGFAEAVNGLDASTIENASIAGKSIAEMAETLPNSGGVVSWFTGNNDMETFGEQLVSFGKAMRKYSHSISGINTDAIVESATVGTALSELASSLPNSGGVVSWFTGNNDMDDFAKQLVPFGKAMKEYSDAIDGMNIESVTNSATAGLAIAELATALPDTGGINSWFTGDNDMKTFAKQLVPFGEAMKEYSDSIDGINSEAIMNSTVAGQALVELANTIPSTEGLMDFINNVIDVSSLHDTLVILGETITDFANTVTDLRPSVVNKAIIAGEALIELANTIPESGGLFGFFNGTMDVATVGTRLTEFGRAIMNFANEVTDLRPSVVNRAVTVGETLIELANTIPYTGGLISMLTGDNDMKKFSEGLTAFGTAIKDFADEVTDLDNSAIDKAVTAGTTLIELAKTIPYTGGLVTFLDGNQDMNTFSKQLVPFGTAIMGFSKEVTDLDVDAVTTAAIAGSTIIELAKTVPYSGGLVSFFNGDRDMNTFSKQLVPFGTAMKEYSDAVEGISVEAVENSTIAGKAIVELANTIPYTGNVFTFLTDGNNDMAEFSKQLVPFGTAMKEYSDAVEGISVEAVENSTIAGQAVAELANTLPNTGGIVSWFTGDNNIGEFGESLIVFGEKFKEYSDYMKDVDSGVVTATASAASSIIELQNSLPKSGGWFSDDTTLSSFGNDLSAFGQYFATFYDRIKDVEVDTVSTAVEELKKLVAVAKDIETVDSSAVSGFGEALTTIAKNTISDFVAEFTNANENISNAICGTLTYAINGMTKKQPEVVSTMNTIIEACIKAITDKYKEFTTAGHSITTKIASGMLEKQTYLLSKLSNMLAESVSTIRTKYYSEFYNTGAYLVAGFANGISDNIQLAANKAAEMAKAASDAANKALDVNSPSKVGYSTGDFYGIGFVNGIGNNISKAYNISEKMANSAIDGLRNVINYISEYVDSNMDVQPTIRPILDLTNVTAGVSNINDLLNGSQTSFGLAASIAQAQANNDKTYEQNQNEGGTTSTGNTYNFIQNNTSPKALSRIEIYRQTRNQFAQFKEATS
jgi:hypothetical protein